ncbi:glutamate--tRNA ligase [Patescibacteria group bacterium]|nr:glutamate--tRNA ligase [Patescibacteria group bacterium]MBU1074786.1 glutamate--tRNA ligase [Patescibacteria group bacterium]MBU1951789.1 glutamate--tRNA ligase [Patescibacteria group bacterium]MBU2235781.1 glutamate--tRNA ligase [Patescibacteria group bacterium]
MNKNEVRVRIAPSPTGPLHLGTARSALYNYLFAKQIDGTFVLRIEDTDLERSEEKYTKQIIEGLEWLGIEYDEGPTSDGKEKGDYGPYFQTKRTKVYEKYIQKLLDEDEAYYCFCSKDELDAERKAMEEKGKAPKYSGKCAHLSGEEKEAYKKEGRNSIIRYRVPDKTITFKDTIRGEVTFETKLLGDISIARDVKTPLYNLAVVIDDYTMEISHVIRGEDHLSNTPKQILLTEALGFPVPQFAHLPLILNEDKTKLSKRKTKVTVDDYKEEGYLPGAILNFILLLGWNPKTEEEIFTLEQMTKIFNIGGVHKGGAVFATDKLDWINAQYLRKLSADEFLELAMPYLEKAGLDVSNKEYVKKAILLEQERIKKLSDLPEMVKFFFQDISYDPKLLVWKKSDPEVIKANLKIALEFFESLDEKDWTESTIEKGLMKLIEEKGLKNGEILWPIRVALTGKEKSPSPFEVAGVLGKERVMERINDTNFN